MEYRIHQHKFESFNRYYDIVRAAMNQLGHTETKKAAEINFFNHIATDEESAIILKPTGPTAKHFALDRDGYANSSRLAFEKPELNEDIEQMRWDLVEELKHRKTNKWDDSILLKWVPAKNIPEDHVLVIAQMPDDETVNGFSFGNHLKKVEMIIDKLLYNQKYHACKNIVLKLHPRWKPRSQLEHQLINKWNNSGVDVRTGYNLIHDFLPRTRVAILENSTAGIECLMHGVPIISYGWPEYHWATKKLQSLTQLSNLVTDLTWHDPLYCNRFIEWYINHYLCTDINSTVKRLKQLI